MDFFNDHGLDPYKILEVTHYANSKEVKRAYKKKALILHPDKTEGRTEYQFKLVVLAYRCIIKNCIDTPTATFEEIKNADRSEEVGYARNFYDIDFDDQATRNELFVDDDLHLDDFKKEMGRVQGLSTSYSAENFYKKEVLDTMKTKGKFDREKFNAFFLKLQKDGKIQNQLVKKEKVMPCNADNLYVNVSTYCDKMINSIDKGNGNYGKLMKQNVITNSDMEKLMDTDAKIIDSLIKENKKNTGKITKKKLKDLVNTAKVHIPVNTELTFEQSKERMLLEKLEELKISQENQKEFVMKNKRIFANSLSYK
jgi:hypothetical protein